MAGPPCTVHNVRCSSLTEAKNGTNALFKVKFMLRSVQQFEEGGGVISLSADTATMQKIEKLETGLAFSEGIRYGTG